MTEVAIFDWRERKRSPYVAVIVIVKQSTGVPLIIKLNINVVLEGHYSVHTKSR